MDGFISRGFGGGRRRRREGSDRLPPGQYVEDGFPVLTAGPTPRVSAETWRFAIEGAVEEPRTWSLDDLQALGPETIPCDIHCVTKWSKLGTEFGGISLDRLFDLAGLRPEAAFAVAHSYGGYTTNLPLDDLRGGKAWVVWEHEGAPLPVDHGGPARLLVPHLYLWKSAKWVAGLQVLDHDEPGFWERNGYHARGDPWQEQRYWND